MYEIKLHLIRRREENLGDNSIKLVKKKIIINELLILIDKCLFTFVDT